MYSHRIKYHSLPSERAVFAILLDKINRIEFYQKENKLVVFGKIAKEYVDADKQPEALAFDEAEEGKMILYNYFSPNLILALESFELNIKYM